jgi:hypothetical protein
MHAADGAFVGGSTINHRVVIVATIVTGVDHFCNSLILTIIIIGSISIAFVPIVSSGVGRFCNAFIRLISIRLHGRNEYLMNVIVQTIERPSLERTLSFEDIADRVVVPLDKVEWVIMRALSLKLIKGTMDQVDQTVDVQWVVPRVLDKKLGDEVWGMGREG